MKLCFIIISLLSGLLNGAWAAGDNPVLYWNEQALNATRLARNPPPIASAYYATYHAAIFDAVNGITSTHRGWLVQASAPTGANPAAAIASASFAVLNALWGQAANPRNFQLAYDRALEAIPDGPGKESGLAWGRQVAALILANRAQSGFDRPRPGQYASTEPGLWRETPPGFRPPVLPYWGKVTPFVLTSPAQFRAPPPPLLTSQSYADELAQISRIGGRDGAERTEYETLSPAFWADDLGTATPPGHWNVIAQDLARRNQLSTEATARLFALLNLATADAAIACWETKYFYRTWRPETAIRELDAVLNPFVRPQPNFIPLMVTPAFPGYVSGHSTFSAAAAQILTHFFGTDDIEFTVTSEGLPGAVRSFKQLSACRDEIGRSRLFGGIHVRSDDAAGQAMGIKIGDWVFAHALLPNPTPRGP
ncbi:MAG: vanadium-dependent haloperoxidase [Opitutaceae bacterium]